MMPLPTEKTLDPPWGGAPPQTERVPDAHDLRNYLDRFIGGNTHSNDVEHRWLASYAADLMTQAYNVKAGNHNTIKHHVDAFRLNEIKLAREKLAAQDKALEAEARKLTVEKEK